MNKNLLAGAIFVGLIAAVFWLGYDSGHTAATLVSDKAIADVREEHARLRTAAAEAALLDLQTQQARTLAAQQLLAAERATVDDLKRTLSQERIAHVSTTYSPAKGAKPVPSPRFIVTCGWLRDYNAAIRAVVSAPAACAVATGSGSRTWATPGSDSELLESGVSAADILAHIRDYGAWSLNNLAQLNALRGLHAHAKEPR